ncbi:MAG: DNA polymerase III subunit epsilon, partial [Pseudomonadota bacterium]
VEIGCVELFNLLPTGKTFQSYINPEMRMPQNAFEIHGLSDELLADKPIIRDVIDDFLAFVDDAPLIAHNAGFDIDFLNAELKRLERSNLSNEVIDTLVIARRQFPGARVSLDALANRFQVDLSAREKHGALLDSEILAEVYLELMGGRQKALLLTAEQSETRVKIDRPYREPRSFVASDQDIAAHRDFLKEIKDPIWLSIDDVGLEDRYGSA